MSFSFDFSQPTDDLLEQIIDFISNRPRFEDVNESSFFFLSVLEKFPNYLYSSIFLINQSTMEFEQFQTYPGHEIDFAIETFDYLIENSTIGEAVGNKKMSINTSNPYGSVFVVNPMLSVNDIIGLVVINVSEFDNSQSMHYYYALTLLSSFFAKIIEIQLLRENETNNQQILEQRIAERTLDLLKSKAEMHEKFGDLRTNLTMALPHEIRTPLGMIMGNSDFLLKNLDMLDPEDLQDIVKDINQSSRRINDLFENYIYFANLELIAIDPIALEKLQENTLEHYSRLTEDFANVISQKYDRSADLKVNLIDAKISFSENHFVKLINEIIDNSFKYSSPGSLVIIDSYSIEDSLFISFIDHGRGMTTEQIQTVDAYIQFERFKYEQQGLGLGLAIVRRLISLHNGELFIESDYGKFTKFTIKLKIVK